MCSSAPIVSWSVISERSNRAGFYALRACPAYRCKNDIRVDPVQFSGVLHLKSGLTELAPNVLIHDPALKTEYDLTWADVVELPARGRIRRRCDAG